MPLPLVAGALLAVGGRIAVSVGGRALLSAGTRMLVGQGARVATQQGARGLLQQGGRELLSEGASSLVDGLVPNPLDPMGIIGGLAEEKLGFNPLSPTDMLSEGIERLTGSDSDSGSNGSSSDSSSNRNGFDLGSVLGGLGSLGGIGAVAGLLIAAIQALASAGEGNGNSTDGGIVQAGFRPVHSAYSGDDKGQQADQHYALSA